ncbi:SRPBCC domain-containing protein [Streptomyces capparidis]
MEHLVNVPRPVDDVRRALADPQRLFRLVPGLQTEPGEPGADGGTAAKLRLRVGGSTITYRGTLRARPRGDGLRVEADGGEARGDGGVKLRLDVAAEPGEEEGTAVLRFSGTVEADGRLSRFDDDTADAAGRRLLDRFGTELAGELDTDTDSAQETDSARGTDGDTDLGVRDEGDEGTSGVAGSAAGDPASSAESPPPSPPSDPADTAPADEPAPDGPPSSADGPSAPSSDAARPDAGLGPADSSDEPVVGNARRTMIGRSTEEVDHAPPRGRYAPVAAPETVRAAATLRWAGPAAAALVASAVVVSRVLRRRR